MKMNAIKTNPIKGAAILMAVVILMFSGFPLTVQADESAYDTLLTARGITHNDGPFRLRGSETAVFIETVNGKATQTKRNYQITGYDMSARETLLQFEGLLPSTTGSGTKVMRTAFLLTLEKVYAKTMEVTASANDATSSEWVERDITGLLPTFVSLGTLDQFFMLELLNSDRLNLYKDYLSHGEDAKASIADCRTVKADISREQFVKLVEALTADMGALLGAVAKDMSEQQLSLLQTFARGILKNLDAEVHYTFYIDKETGRILQIDSTMDMANPYGSRAPGTSSRVKSSGSVSLYDFGKAIPQA